MQLQSYGKAVTIVNNKVKDLDEHHIDYDGNTAKIKARKNNKITYAKLTPKHIKKLFTNNKSKNSLQENLESLLKNNKRKKRTRRKKRKHNKKRGTRKCRYKIGSKKGKYKKC